MYLEASLVFSRILCHYLYSVASLACVRKLSWVQPEDTSRTATQIFNIKGEVPEISDQKDK